MRGYGFPEHRRMGFAKQDSVYGNPDWYLATFVRDPLERLVSGYLDKCVDARKRVGEKHCDPAVRSDVDWSSGMGPVATGLDIR